MKQIIRSGAGFAAVLLGGCAGPQSATDTHGDPATGVMHLMMFIIVVCSIVWVLVVAVLAWALWRRRPLRSDPSVLDARTEHRMRIVVVGSVAVTVVVITIFTLASYLTSRNLAFAGPDALTIRVRGHQWWWEVTYPDALASQTFATANEIHIPIGRPVHIQLAAADVIHSFWVPSLAGKQDLIPGRDNEIAFIARRSGIYRGQCAEFCGFQHARMAVFVMAEEPEAFETWRRSQLQEAVTPSGNEQQTGQKVFAARACSTCHTIRGTSAAGKLGPDLTHIASRKAIAAGVLENTRGSLAAWIADPQTIKPGNNMPMVPLSADELNALSAYMTSLR